LLPQRYRLEELRYEAERLRLESENRVPEPRGIPAVNPKERPA
jgi:hypothetical protein